MRQFSLFFIAAPLAEETLPSEPVRPQSLPLSSGTRHTETWTRQSATPPGSSFAIHQATLNPPPPLIQMSSSRDKKYPGAQDLTKETPRSREGFFVHSKSFHDCNMLPGHETSSGRDGPRHTHTPVDHRGSEREKRTPVVETVDLTRDKEVSTSPLTRPTSRSPVVALSSSSARDRLQAMAKYALAEANNADVTDKIAQKKREETHLPPRTPDPKLSVYEQSEAIRKFTALGNVCVSAPREFHTGGEYPSQPYALMAMQTQHQLHVHPHPTEKSTPPPYGYPFHVGHPMASFHHHPEHRFLVPLGVHQILPHSVNGEDLPNHLKLSGAFAHQYPQAASYFPAGIRSVVPTYQPMAVCGHRYPVPLSEERRTLQHPLDVPVRRSNDISEQDLANPFVVKQSRHMHTPGMPERVVSPGELPKFPLPSRSPVETTKHPHAISPEMKPQVAAHGEVTKTVSPPAGTYLSRIPSRPASVSEMRNRAAVIPELKETDAVSRNVADHQPVLVPSSRDSSRENFSRLEEQTSDGDAKEQGKKDKSGSYVEAIPMSAFATLVDVAAAARKVDIPFYERENHESEVFFKDNTRKRETTELEETYGSSHGGLVPSPPRTSPGTSSVPRYGITTGLVPKPPPLMPITGMRSMLEGSSITSTPLSISVGGGHSSVSTSRGQSKLTSPPGTRTRGSVSPDGPPPLISRSVISPTGLSQRTSPKGPPPLIRGIVSPVPPTLRSDALSDADSIVKTRPSQESIVSEETFRKGVTIIDQDLQQTFSIHLHESPPPVTQMADSGDAITTCKPGHSQVRTIVETRICVDPVHTVMQHPPGDHLKTLQSSTGMPEECPRVLSSSSIVVKEPSEATSVGGMSQTPAENDTNMQAHSQPEQPTFVSGQSVEIKGKVQASWQVNQVYSSEQGALASSSSEQLSLQKHELPSEAFISHASGSETEDGDEGESDTEDEVHAVHSSSGGLHPRVRVLVKSSHSNLQPSFYDASDSETLSAEESEVLPESSDEMFPCTTTKAITQADSICEGGRHVEDGSTVQWRDSSINADPSVDVDIPYPGVSIDDFENENKDTETPRTQSKNKDDGNGLQDTVTSTGPNCVYLIELKESMEDSPTTSTLPGVNAEEEKEAGVSLSLELKEPINTSDQELVTSQSSPAGETVVEEDSSEALPASTYSSVYEEDTIRLQSSEDSLVGSSETDLAAFAPQVQSSHQQVSEDIPDSSAYTWSIPDLNETPSTKVNFENYDQNAPHNSALMTVNSTSFQSLTEMKDDAVVKVTDTEDAYAFPSTSEVEKKYVASAASDLGDEEFEIINEADSLEKTPAEYGFLHDAETYSSSSDNHPPEISSAMDDVSDDEHLSFSTFIGEFVPLPGTVDSPDIRSACSTHITSEESSVCDENISEREMKEVYKPPPLNPEDSSGVLSPDEGNRHIDTLSEGEIAPSQENSQSDDELASVGDKSVHNEATAVVTNTLTEKPWSAWHPDSSQTVTDRDQLPSQSKEIVDDDQLSEGEIPESDDEPNVHTNTFPVVSSSSGDADSTRVSAQFASVVSSQEATLQADCYINMIPISPAPPESPSHESESDRASPLPPWPPNDGQYSSVVSLSMAARITPFPYSTLSINVGSASSSARSSPVPQALAVNLPSGSSPSSSSFVARPQEPTPLLSDNYEPLSDDDDGDDMLADTSNISGEQDI